MILYGSLKNNVFEFSNDKNCYKKDEITIAIDGDVNSFNFNNIFELYKKFSCHFVDYLEDFVSVILYDENKKELLLVNDRMGLKAIYYHVASNGDVFFANDVNALMQHYPIQKEINIDCLSMYFRYHCIPAPQTIYKNVKKIKNGHLIKINQAKQITNICYWNMYKIYNYYKKDLIKNPSEITKQIEEKLKNDCKKYLGDNKTGLYVSGGIDSSLLAALLSEISDTKINTFSIGFDDLKHNEADRAKKIANFLGTNHHEFYLNDNNAVSFIKKMPDYYTEPLGDASQVATVALNELAKSEGIKIAFTGDGADQLFCGAEIYDFLYEMQKLRKFVNPLGLQFKCKFLKKRRKLFSTFYRFKKELLDQCDILYKEQLSFNGFFNDCGQRYYDYEKEIKTKNLQEKRMLVDLNSFMPDRVVTKMRCAAINNNIEIRSPFLAKEFIAFTFKIPHKYKYYKKQKKYILKNTLFRFIPKQFYDNTKHGFSIPAGKWLKTILNNDLKRVSSQEFITKQNIFKFEQLQQILSNIDQNSSIVWDFYMFQLWYEKYILA